MKTIKMGNDEFILYIRKWNTQCSLTNEVLGRKIWDWIKTNDINARQIEEDKPTLWEKQGLNIDADKLPKTATQFEFKRSRLEALYDFLDSL